MKQLLYILLLLCVGCTNTVEKPAAIPAKAAAKPEKVDVNVLKHNKLHIDSLFKFANGKRVAIYVRQTGSDSIIKVAARNLPENILCSFSIYSDKNGKIIMIAETPFIESYDEIICCTHYFDEGGRTFAFERKINLFNPRCTGGVVLETKVLYYDEKFQQLDYTYEIVDENGRDMIKDSCNIAEYQYKIYPTVTAFLQSKSIHLK